MAQSYLNISVNAETAMTAAPTGKYSLFLNSTHSDTLYKIDDAGVVTSAVNGLIDPMTTAGDMIIRDGLNVIERLGVGSAGQVLTVSGGLPSWQTPSGGTVTSVSGTTNRVTSTGGTTPVIDISATFEALLGKVANPLSQFAATTSAQLAGVISDETGSGALVFGTSPTFTTDISAPKIISSTASAGLLLCNNNGVTVASFGVGSAGSTNIGLIGATAVTGTISGTSSLTLGTASSVVGSIVLQNATNANTITIQSGVTTSSHTLTLPVANASGVLTNNGSGTLTWAAASSGITVGTTTITGGGDYRILFQDATASDFVTQSSNFTYGGFFAGYLNVLTGYAINGSAFLHKAANGLCVGNNNTSGDYNVVVGQSAGNSLNASSIGNIGVGWGSLNSVSSGDYNICIGQSAGGSNTSNSICIGAYTTCNANNTFVSGGSTASGTWISSVYFGSGITDATAQSVTFNATGGSGTNNAGANITIAGGKGTGTGAGGYVKTTTSVKGASGTTVQSDTDRNTIIAKYVDVTGGAATTFANLALATSSTIAGGVIVYTVEANDGTDFQSLTGTAPYSVVNKAGTLTYVLGTDVQSSACSAGTLTGTLSLTASGTTMSFQMNAVSSLVETVLRVSFQVLNNMGVATISAA